MRKGKQTKHKEYRKNKTTVITPLKSDNECPVWMFDNVDKAGEFAFDLNRDDFQHQEFLDKMINYSNMKWIDIKKQTHDNGKSKHHYVAYEKLSKTAQDRIVAKHLEQDSDDIFSFALQNKLRVIGIRRERAFHVLWYDPEHEVCPSHKKAYLNYKKS